MRIKLFLIFKLLIFNSISSFLYAQDLSYRVYETPQVDVIDERNSQTVGHSTSSIYIDLEDNSKKLQSLSEVLHQQAGVRVQSFGGDSDANTISLRGSFSDEVSIYLDGVLLNNGSLGSVNLSYYSISNLKSIEIYKGSTPVYLGFPSAGGAIYLKSKNNSEKKQELHQSFSGGSFSSFQSNSKYFQRFNRSSIHFGFNIDYLKGNYKFLDDNGTPVFNGDDEIQSKINNQSLSFHPSFGFEAVLDSKTDFSGQIHLIQKHKGISGISTNQSDQSKLSYREVLINLKLERDDFLFDKLELSNLSYLRWSKSQFTDLEGKIGLGGFQDNDDDTILFGNRINLEREMASYLRSHFFLEFQAENYSPQNYLSSNIASEESNRKRFLLGLSNIWSVFGSQLEIETSLWSEFIKNQMNDSDPSLSQSFSFENNNSHQNISGLIGLKYELFPSISIKSHLNRGFRYPHFSELFGDRGDRIGNPFLEPQESLNADIGLSFSKKWDENRLNFDIEYFYKKIDNFIQFVQKGNFVRSENIGEAEVYGVETSLRADLWEHFRLSSNYTYNRAKDKSGVQERELVGRPRHQVGVDLELYHKKTKLFYQINWLDKYFLDELNSLRVDDKILMNIGASYDLSQSVSLSLKVKNLTNEETVDQLGFPLPGRGGYGRIDFKI